MNFSVLLAPFTPFTNLHPGMMSNTAKLRTFNCPTLNPLIEVSADLWAEYGQTYGLNQGTIILKVKTKNSSAMRCDAMRCE
jgi:hypothetical protein